MAYLGGFDPSSRSGTHSGVWSAILRQHAVHQQQLLGGEFTLRGYLTRDWISALASQGAEKPEPMVTHLYLGLWQILFQSIWDKRNEEAHGYDSIVTRIEHDNMLAEIKEWKRTAASRLGTSQTYLIDYTLDDIQKWSTSTMKAMLRLLVKAASNYQASLSANGQQLITEHFQPIVYNTTTDHSRNQ